MATAKTMLERLARIERAVMARSTIYLFEPVDPVRLAEAEAAGMNVHIFRFLRPGEVVPDDLTRRAIAELRLDDEFTGNAARAPNEGEC
jgi:hypothetical protein